MSAAETNPAHTPETAPSSSPAEQLVQDAVVVLTRLARLTYPTGDGGTGRVDFADWLAEAVTRVAANVDGVDELLAGRPGSWEADLVRQLVCGTVGWDGGSLPLYRTDPIYVDADAEALLSERTDGAWDRAWQYLAERASTAAGDLYERLIARHEGEPWVTVPPPWPIAYRATTPQEVQAQEAYWARVETERAHMLELYPQLRAAEAVEETVDAARQAAQDAYRDALLAAANVKARELGYQVPVLHAHDAVTWLGEELLTHALNVTPGPQPPGGDWIVPALPDNRPEGRPDSGTDATS